MPDRTSHMTLHHGLCLFERWQLCFSFLSIPPSDVARLSIRPLKWLRFVTFTICGARGDLSTNPNGPPINYDTVLADIAEVYHYTPDGEPSFIRAACNATYAATGEMAFIDFQGMSDRITSSVQTQRRSKFRQAVIERDGPYCVFTRWEAESCDATHIIPRCKGNEAPVETFEC